MRTIIELGHIGVGGQKGYVYDPQGICPCLPATQYKDPTKILEIVENKKKIERNICYLTPNNFKHKAGDGTKTRERKVSYIHPALQANCGETQCTYVLLVERTDE